MSEAKEKKVKLHVPRSNNKGEEYILIGLNGVMTKIPCGQTSEVSQEIAEEYNRAMEAKDWAMGNLEEEQIKE